MRTSNKILNSSLKKQIYNLFNQVIVDTKTTEEADLIFSELLKPSEYELIVKRLAIAYWLTKGRSYKNIKDNLQVSSATIALVQKQLDSKGIKHAVKLMEAEEWAEKWASKFEKFTTTKLK